jgi:hypothetical protein
MPLCKEIVQILMIRKALTTNGVGTGCQDIRRIVHPFQLLESKI